MSRVHLTLEREKKSHNGPHLLSPKIALIFSTFRRKKHTGGEGESHACHKVMWPFQ